MVEISLSGSGEGPGWATAPGDSTVAFSAPPRLGIQRTSPPGDVSRPLPGKTLDWDQEAPIDLKAGQVFVSPLSS